MAFPLEESCPVQMQCRGNAPFHEVFRVPFLDISILTIQLTVRRLAIFHFHTSYIALWTP